MTRKFFISLLVLARNLSLLLAVGILAAYAFGWVEAPQAQSTPELTPLQKAGMLPQRQTVSPEQLGGN